METTVKPGWKSSEFWLTLAAVIGSLLISSGLLVSVPVALKITGIIVGALAAFGYSYQRSELKAQATATQLELRRLELRK